MLTIIIFDHFQAIYVTLCFKVVECSLEERCEHLQLNNGQREREGKVARKSDQHLYQGGLLQILITVVYCNC